MNTAVEFTAHDHTYRANGRVYPSVTQILSDMGFYGNAAAYFTEYSRDRGRFIHQLVQYHIEGVLDEESIDPVLRPYFDAWLSFEQDTGFVSECCEVPLASATHQFAGTPDHVGHLYGHAAVIDVKSGVINPAASIQTAAYDILIGSPRIERFGLQLKDNGKYSLKQCKDRNDRGIFIAALSVWWWKKNNL